MTKTNNWNIIIRGHYGYGKTVLALLLAAVVGMYTYQLPDSGGNVRVGSVANHHIIDECHNVRKFEQLYPLMEKYNFTFCTNMGSSLPEPFISRCISFRLEPYSLGELSKIVALHAGEQGFVIDSDAARVIAARCKGVPRTGIMFVQKYGALGRFRGVELDGPTVRGMFVGDGIDERGLDSIDRQYLHEVSHTAKSFNTLMSTLAIDAGELRRREAHLIREQLITITTRGRIHDSY